MNSEIKGTKSFEISEFTFRLDDLISVDEAADRLGISPRRVRSLIANNCDLCDGSGKMNSNGRIEYLRPIDEGVVHAYFFKPGFECPNCFGTGRRLAAVQVGRAYAVVSDAVHNVEVRPSGRPKSA